MRAEHDNLKKLGTIRQLHSLDATKVFPEANPKDVLLHGDMALPNIMATDEGDIGYIDFGQLSFGSPELDLADAIWSLQRNRGPAYGKLFLEKYGRWLSRLRWRKRLITGMLMSRSGADSLL